MLLSNYKKKTITKQFKLIKDLSCSGVSGLVFGRPWPSWPWNLPVTLCIPDICHLDHLHVGGEKICHVEKFQISIHEISPHEEEFQFYHTTDVEKFGEISHFSTGLIWGNLKFMQFFVIKSVLRCFCEIRFGAIYALLRGEKFCKKLGRWRKIYKYEVCPLSCLDI